MEPGPLTVVSHSISIDVPSLEKAKKIADGKESDEVLDRRRQDRSALRPQRCIHDDLRPQHVGTGRGTLLRRHEAPRVSRQVRGRDRAATGPRCGAVGNLARALPGPRNRAQGIRDEGGERSNQRMIALLRHRLHADRRTAAMGPRAGSRRCWGSGRKPFPNWSASSSARPRAIRSTWPTHR